MWQILGVISLHVQCPCVVMVRDKVESVFLLHLAHSSHSKVAAGTSDLRGRHL